MMHLRKWCVHKTEDAAKAATILKGYTNACFGVQLGHVLLINDSTDSGSDSFTEYAVIDTRNNTQIDSWTIDWMNKRELENDIKALVASQDQHERFATYVPFSSEFVEYSDSLLPTMPG